LYGIPLFNNQASSTNFVICNLTKHLVSKTTIQDLSSQNSTNYCVSRLFFIGAAAGGIEKNAVAYFFQK
jgi:hypothetical protein